MIARSDRSTDYINTWYVKLFQALFYSQGFILPFLRMLEPGALELHIRLLRRLLKCKKVDAAEEEEIRIEPISILFNSTLNIEFVYVILDGIVKFSQMNFASLDQDKDVFNLESE